MPVTVYRWDDTSAPALTNARGSLGDLLKACLVNGYGAKAAAGWTAPFEDAVNYKIAFLQGGASNKKHLMIDGYTTNNNKVRGYKTMSAVDVGTGDFPSVAQVPVAYLYTEAGSHNGGNSEWMVIADDRTFYLFIRGNTNATNFGYGWLSYAFGDIYSNVSADASKCFASFCTYNSTYPSLGTVTDYNTHSTKEEEALSDDYTGAGGSTITRKGYSILGSNRTASNDKMPELIGQHGLQYPDPITGGIILSPIYLSEGGGVGNILRGNLRGLWAPCHDRPLGNLDTFSGSGDLAGKTFIAVNTRSTRGSAINYNDGQLIVETSDTWATSS